MVGGGVKRGNREAVHLAGILQGVMLCRQLQCATTWTGLDCIKPGHLLLQPQALASAIRRW